MEDSDALQKLSGNFTGVAGAGRILNVLAEIAARDVFHGDVVEIFVLVPAVKDNKEFLVLAMFYISLALVGFAMLQE